MIEDVGNYPAEERTIQFPKLARELRIQVIRDVLWYRGCKTEPVMVVFVRHPSGQWRDEALVATDPTVSAEFVIQGYCRRWSVELSFFDSKQHLGLHDPQDPGSCFRPGQESTRFFASIHSCEDAELRITL